MDELRTKVLEPILASNLPERQKHHDIIFLLAGTGMRNGEVDRLRPMDVIFLGGDPGKGRSAPVRT